MKVTLLFSILQGTSFYLIFARKYIPVLKKYPPKYIYEPWTAPLSVQRAAGCVIGKDYPRPIVDHKAAVKTNLARMKKARADHYGGDTDINEGDLLVLSLGPIQLAKLQISTGLLSSSVHQMSWLVWLSCSLPSQMSQNSQHLFHIDSLHTVSQMRQHLFLFSLLSLLNQTSHPI